MQTILSKIHHNFNLSLEGVRAAHDLYESISLSDHLEDITPDGDGSPVILVPGFLTPDLYMQYTHKFLERKGWSPYGWGQGVNLGPKSCSIDDFSERLVEIYEQHGGKPLKAVGYSLGGTGLMAVANKLKGTGVINRIITLGSPVGSNALTRDARNVNTVVSAIFNAINCPLDQNVVVFMDHARKAILDEDIDVQCTHIYSRIDGIVYPEDAISPYGTKDSENIEINAGHIALPFNAAVLYTIADRLALPERTLKPFKAPLKDEKIGGAFFKEQWHNEPHNKSTRKSLKLVA